MKGNNVEFFWNKISFTGSNWSNAPSTETPVSHPLLSESVFPFSAPAPSFLPLWGNKELELPSMKGKKVDFFWNKISFTGCKWSNMKARSTETPVSHPLLSEF